MVWKIDQWAWRGEWERKRKTARGERPIDWPLGEHKALSPSLPQKKPSTAKALYCINRSPHPPGGHVVGRPMSCNWGLKAPAGPPTIGPLEAGRGKSFLPPSPTSLYSLAKLPSFFSPKPSLTPLLRRDTLRRSSFWPLQIATRSQSLCTRPVCLSRSIRTEPKDWGEFAMIKSGLFLSEYAYKLACRKACFVRKKRKKNIAGSLNWNWVMWI